MRKLIRESGAWLAVGVAAGVLLAPAAAVGAAGLVRIVGSNGKRAEVTPANQLQTASASPAQFRSVLTFVVSSSCLPVFTAPAKKGVVVTSIVFNVLQNSTPGIDAYAAVYRTASCANSNADLVARDTPTGTGVSVVPFEPGFALKAGAKLYAKASGGVLSDLRITGYLVPKNAVPRTTPTTS
jgi:hypothetical protein